MEDYKKIRYNHYTRKYENRIFNVEKKTKTSCLAESKRRELGLVKDPWLSNRYILEKVKIE